MNEIRTTEPPKLKRPSLSGALLCRRVRPQAQGIAELALKFVYVLHSKLCVELKIWRESSMNFKASQPPANNQLVHRQFQLNCGSVDPSSSRAIGLH